VKEHERQHVRDRVREKIMSHGLHHSTFNCDLCAFMRAVLAFTPGKGDAAATPECGVSVSVPAVKLKPGVQGVVDLRVEGPLAGRAKHRLAADDALRIGLALVAAAVDAGAKVTTS